MRFYVVQVGSKRRLWLLKDNQNDHGIMENLRLNWTRKMWWGNITEVYKMMINVCEISPHGVKKVDRELLVTFHEPCDNATLGHTLKLIGRRFIQWIIIWQKLGRWPLADKELKGDLKNAWRTLAMVICWDSQSEPPGSDTGCHCILVTGGKGPRYSFPLLLLRLPSGWYLTSLWKNRLQE